MHTQWHALSHPPTHKRTHAPNLYAHFSCTLTHISLSFSLFPSLSVSLSLLHTYTDTHTHSHSHTHSLMNSLIHSFIVVACARCVVFSARTRARSLLSVSLPLPPFLVRFLSNSISFVLFLPSRWLASSLSLSHSFASSFFTMISIWNSQTLTASAFFHSLARGIFSQMEHWRRRIKGEINWWERIGISLYPWHNFLEYYRTRLTVVAYDKLATLRFVAYYKRFSLITGSRLLCIYIYIYIYSYAMMMIAFIITLGESM